MDELVGLLLLEELQNEEEAIQGEEVQVERVQGDPFVELNNKQFLKIFRVTKELCNFIIQLCEPFMQPRRRATDLDIFTKVSTTI